MTAMKKYGVGEVLPEPEDEEVQEDFTPTDAAELSQELQTESPEYGSDKF